jgi:hypothetical protein
MFRQHRQQLNAKSYADEQMLSCLWFLVIVLVIVFGGCHHGQNIRRAKLRSQCANGNHDQAQTSVLNYQMAD